jgi:hypothetical protein
MSASFTVNLDTSPPAAPTMTIEWSALATGSRTVTAMLDSADYQRGSQDVAEMKIWGDVDPTADALVQPTENGSTWQIFRKSLVLALSPGPGPKQIRGRLRDDVYNETTVFGTSIIFDSGYPVVSITRGVERSRISKVPPFNTLTFFWSSSLDYDQAELRVVPGPGSPHTSGISLHTFLPGSAGAETQTTIDGAGLALASPGDWQKVLKVFVRSTAGVWSL